MNHREVAPRFDPQEVLARCEAGVEAALRAGADQAELYAQAERKLQVVFMKNDLDLVKTSTELTVGVRVMVDQRQGFATTNRPEDLAETAAEAVAIARAAPRDEHLALPEAMPLAAATPALDPAILGLDASALTRIASDLMAAVSARDPRITVDTAEFATTEHVLAIASSLGVRAHHHTCSASGDIFGMAVDGSEVGSFSYDGDRVRHLEDLVPQVDSAFARFVAKCLGALGATAGESFRGTVLVPPEAVVTLLLAPIFEMAQADRVRQGQSPLAELLGQAIAVPGFTLREAGTGFSDYRVAPFDREGQARVGRSIVEDGVLKSFLYDAYEARRAGTRSTGHAQGGASGPPRVGAGVIELAPGTTPMAELTALDRGVVLTRFAGTIMPTTGDFSGVVKGGSLVRGGEARPIKETTVAGNVWTCLKNISGLSQETLTMHGTSRVPWVRLEDVAITAG